MKTLDFFGTSDYIIFLGKIRGALTQEHITCYNIDVMRNFKTITLVLFFVFVFVSSAHALKVEENPYASTFHLGLVFGPGTGLDLGADFLFPFEALQLGFEGEIIITDYEFEVNINGRRLGGVLRYEFIEDFFSLGAHFGKTWFTVSRDVEYLDVISGEKYVIYENSDNSATYLAASFDFIVFDGYILTPKLIMNSVDGGGSLLEFNLNIGHEF